MQILKAYQVLMQVTRTVAWEAIMSKGKGLYRCIPPNIKSLFLWKMLGNDH